MNAFKIIGIVIIWILGVWIMHRIKESVYPTKKKTKEQYFKDEEKKRDNYFK